MKVLDLFAGLGGWSAAFKDRGHDVVTIDFESKFKCTYTMDIMDLTVEQVRWINPDIILASPPCTCFSVASIGTYWDGGSGVYHPKLPATEEAIALVKHTRNLIEETTPKIAVIENPRGVLRKLGLLPEPTTVWYCHYGEQYAKPTDLWGLPFPMNWKPEDPCHNRSPKHAEDCCCRDHVAASRGARTGVQGLKDPATRSLIPYALSYSICLAAEKEII